MSGLNRALFTSAKDRWETPLTFFEELNDEFAFTLDAAALASNALLPRFITNTEITPEDGMALNQRFEHLALEMHPFDPFWGGLYADSLTTVWSYPGLGPERIWLNPPYGNGMSRWMLKAWEESQEGNLVVCLVPVRTDTRWWHDWVLGKAEVRFIKGRLGFTIDGEFPLDKKGRPQRSAPFPSAAVIYRPDKPQASEEFPGLGEMMEGVLARLRKGREEYGDASYDREAQELLGEIEEEFLDVVGRGYLGWRKLRDIKARLEGLETGMVQGELPLDGASLAGTPTTGLNHNTIEGRPPRTNHLKNQERTNHEEV